MCRRSRSPILGWSAGTRRIGSTMPGLEKRPGIDRPHDAGIPHPFAAVDDGKRLRLDEGTRVRSCRVRAVVLDIAFRAHGRPWRARELRDHLAVAGVDSWLVWHSREAGKADRTVDVDVRLAAG